MVKRQRNRTVLFGFQGFGSGNRQYFPSQSFILPKLNDMAECRNKIAHNSYIDDLERNLMKTYYNVILRQISDSTDK